MVLSEVRLALRTLMRHRGYTTVAVLTLAFGIGANTAIFSAVWRLFVEPLPFAASDRLVDAYRTRKGGDFMVTPQPEVALQWRERATSFEGVQLWKPDEQTLTGSGDPAVLRLARIEAGMLGFLDVEPLIGRGFTESEARAGERLILLSESQWRTRFGGESSVLGQRIEVGGEPHTIIGVMPAKFSQFNGAIDLDDGYLPLDPAQAGDFVSVLARLRENVTIEAAQQEIAAIAASVPEHEAMPGAWEYALHPTSELVGTETSRALGILFGAVGLVLLIACANVAGLLLVRLHARRREIGVRAAIGGSRGRILAGVAIEQLLIAVAAGGLGVLIAAWGISAIRAYRPDQLQALDTIALELPVIGFAAILVLATSLVLGVLPTAFMLRGDLTSSLRAGGVGGRVTDGSRLRSVLVTLEIALSVVLVIGALLLVRTFTSLRNEEIGFQPERALALEIAVPGDRYADATSREQFYSTVLEGVGSIPSVQSASVAGGTPPSLGIIFGELYVEGREGPVEDVRYLPGTVATPGYFETIGVRMLEGRDFNGSADDDENAAIVNRAFVQKFWPGESGVGRRLRLVRDAPWTTIVGVIDDMRTHGPRSAVEPQMFRPINWDWPRKTLVVRTTADDPLSVMPLIRQVLHRVDPDVPIREAETLTHAMANSVARERFSMMLLAFFAGLALLLTAVGLYGLVNYTLQQRTREIGIRVALGASPVNVQSQFLAQGALLTAMGLVLGVVAAAAGVTLLRSLLFGVKPYDGASFVAAVVLIAGATLLASWIPARRASRVDPLIALQAE